MFPPDANQSRENGGRGSRRSSRGHGANARGRVQSQFGDLQLQIDALERELSTRLSTKIGEMFVQAVFDVARFRKLPLTSIYLESF